MLVVVIWIVCPFCFAALDIVYLFYLKTTLYWLSCKSPWIGANQLPKDFGYPEHEERDILYTSYLRSEALHLRVQ